MPISGAWKVGFGLLSFVPETGLNLGFLLHNRIQIQDSFIRESSDSGGMTSTSAREVILEASVGDIFELYAGSVMGDYSFVTICFEYIPTM